MSTCFLSPRPALEHTPSQCNLVLPTSLVIPAPPLELESPPQASSSLSTSKYLLPRPPSPQSTVKPVEPPNAIVVLGESSQSRELEVRMSDEETSDMFFGFGILDDHIPASKVLGFAEPSNTIENSNNVDDDMMASWTGLPLPLSPSGSISSALPIDEIPTLELGSAAVSDNDDGLVRVCAIRVTAPDAKVLLDASSKRPLCLDLLRA